MFRSIAPNTLFYRVTQGNVQLRQAQSWVLAGRGAFHSPNGGRYSAPGVQAVYLAEDPFVVIAEMAYYVALDWQDNHLPYHFYGSPIQLPMLSSNFRLWCFRLKHAVNVVQLEHPTAFAQFGHVPFLLRNPSQRYAATQHLAGQVLTHNAPNYPRPQAGLDAPSVRHRHRAVGASAGQQTVFFNAARVVKFDLVQAWDLDFEYRDLAGAPVTSNTSRVDWETAYFQLLKACKSTPTAIKNPPHLLLCQQYSVQVNYS